MMYSPLVIQLLSFLSRHRVFLLIPVLAMTSCADSPQSKSLAHLFQKKSLLFSTTLRNFPNQPQARLTVADSRDKRGLVTHRVMKKGEFEAMWNLFKTDNLDRFHIPKPGTEKVNLNDSYVFFVGEVSAPEKARMYVVPEFQAPHSIKELAREMRNYGPPPGKKASP